MKFYFSLFTLFIILLILGVFVIGSLSQSSEAITQNFSKISDAINKEDWPKAQEEFALTKERWNTHKKWWAMMIDHHEIENIETSLTRADEYLLHQNQALSAGEIAALKQFLEHIPETEKISWKNIF